MKGESMKFGYRDHRSTLQESLQTKQYISINDFTKRSKNYRFYAYDNRCKQLMFIRDEMEHHYTEPTWLFIELEREEK